MSRLRFLVPHKIAAVDEDEEYTTSNYEEKTFDENLDEKAFDEKTYDNDDENTSSRSEDSTELYLLKDTSSFSLPQLSDHGMLRRLYFCISRGDSAKTRQIVQRDVSILDKVLGSFIQVQRGNTIRVCHAPVFPGTPTGEILRGDAIAEISEKQTIQYMHSDGKMYAVAWFQLAGIQGWVHDFSLENPSEPSIHVLNDYTPVLHAVKLKKVGILRYFFSRHAIDSGRKALFTAIAQDDVECIETILVMNPAFINEQYKDLRTPLIYAIVKSAYHALTLLVSLADVDLMWADAHGDTALHWLSRQGPADFVSRLATSAAQLNAKNNEGQTPLMYALEAKNETVALALLQRGSVVLDVTLVDKNGDTVLHMAMSNNMAQVVRFLITQYANTINVNARNEELMTPLMMGLEMSHLESTTALLKGAFLSLDIDQLVNEDDDTAFDIATREKYTEILRAMKEVRAWQWLRDAIYRNITDDITEVLQPLSAGLCSQPLDEQGNTALILAASKGNSALVRQLLAICEDAVHLHQANHSGQTAFNLALESFLQSFKQTVQVDDASVDAAHQLCEEYSRIAWAILSKGNQLSSWLPLEKRRNTDSSSQVARTRWRRSTQLSKERRVVSAFRPQQEERNSSSQRPASAPPRRRSLKLRETPTRQQLFLPQRPRSASTWEDLTSPKIRSHNDGKHADKIPDKTERAAQVNVSVQKFVDSLAVIRRVLGDSHDQEQAWHATYGLVLAIAVAVLESAKAHGLAHNLQLVDVSAEQWTTMVRLHLRTIVQREQNEARQDAEHLVQEMEKQVDGEPVSAFVALANRRVAQSHAVKLFELMAELQNHEALESYVLPHIKQLLQFQLDATTSGKHASFLEHVVSKLRSRASSQRGLYSVVLGRLYNDTGWKPFQRQSMRLADFSARIEGDSPTQSESDLLQSYLTAHAILPRFNTFLERLGAAIGGQAIIAGVKDVFRFIESAALFTATRKKSDGAEGAAEKWSCEHILDVTRGSIVLPDMHSMNMALELFAAVSANDTLREEARERGWDASAFELGETVELVQVRQTFSQPLHNGWADCVVRFRFDSSTPIVELRLVHLEMVNVRQRADTYLKYRTMRSAQELLCYSKGQVYDHSWPTDHVVTDTPDPSANLPEAAAGSGPSTPRQDQSDLQRRQLEEQLSATRNSLRQANSALEDAKTEREKVYAALNAAMEQLDKTTMKMENLKEELVITRAQLQTLSSKAEQNAADVKASNAATAQLVETLKAEGTKTRAELADSKAQLQTLSSKAEQNAADVKASNAATAQLAETLKAEGVKTRAQLVNTKVQLQTVISKAKQNTEGVKASRSAAAQLTETSQMLLKLVLKTTRHTKSKRIRKNITHST